MIVTFVTKVLCNICHHFVNILPIAKFVTIFIFVTSPFLVAFFQLSWNKFSIATRGSFLKIGHKLNMALFIVCENSRLLIGQFVKVVSHPRLTLVKGGRVEAWLKQKRGIKEFWTWRKKDEFLILKKREREKCENWRSKVKWLIRN